MADPAQLLTGDSSLRSPGLVGGGAALVLVGAFASLVVVTDTSLGNAVGWPIWLLLYPLSPLIGYDLATRGGVADDGPLLRLGGYSVAVAFAHVAMAAAIAVGAVADFEGDSPLWYVALATCVAAAVPARAVAVRICRRSHVPAGALVAAAVVILLLAWMAFIVIAGLSFDTES